MNNQFSCSDIHKTTNSKLMQYKKVNNIVGGRG